METDETLYNNRRRPRKLINAKPSKFDVSKAIQINKKYWKKVFYKIDKSETSPYDESRQLAEVLPANIYEKVCNILNMPITTTFIGQKERNEGKTRRYLTKEPKLSFRTSLYITREMESDTDVELSSSDDDDGRTDVHRELLKKQEREQITWATHYLQPEREDEKTLVKKADDLTDRIVKDFCEYMKQLGGDQHSKLFTPNAIKELFQIEFDTHVARSLRIVPTELPTINEKIANVTGNPDKSLYATLTREISRDSIAEHRSDSLKAFGRSLPLHDQSRAPKNNTKKIWQSARHVPNDLVTLKTVWEGITNLRSVKEYCRWMIDHPEYKRPPYLKSLGMFDEAVLDTKLNFNAQNRVTKFTTCDDLPGPIECIRRRLSQMTEST